MKEKIRELAKLGEKEKEIKVGKEEKRRETEGKGEGGLIASDRRSLGLSNLVLPLQNG